MTTHCFYHGTPKNNRQTSKETNDTIYSQQPQALSRSKEMTIMTPNPPVWYSRRSPLLHLRYLHAIQYHLSLRFNLLLTHRLRTLHILIRRRRILFIRLHPLISTHLRRATAELHPEENDRLTDQHADRRSGHTERHTDEDGHEDDLDSGAEDLGHAAEEAVVVMMMMVARGLELDVSGKLDGAVWAAVRDCHVAFVAMLVVVGFMACEFMEAFHAYALHFVSGALGGCFGLVSAGDKLGEDAADNVSTFGVGSVRRRRDGVDGVERELRIISSIS